MLMQDKAFRPGTFSYTRGKLIKGYLMMALNNQQTLDCRVGECSSRPSTFAVFMLIDSSNLVGSYGRDQQQGR
jgi:hypothetical protein